MNAILLAAGRSRRLGSVTDAIPKTLLPVRDDRTILETILGNLRAVGIQRVVIVTGYRSEMIDARVPDLRTTFGLDISTLYNETHLEWNNCYSLWVARDALEGGALVINGDTLHPVSVEEALLKSRGPDVLLALDDQKPLGDEEMKVLLNPDGSARRIHKEIDPDRADGEHIGVSLVEARAAPAMIECLEATWRRQPTLYFEDGYQEFIDRGGRIETVPIGVVPWIEVDNASDYERAREIAARL